MKKTSILKVLSALSIGIVGLLSVSLIKSNKNSSAQLHAEPTYKDGMYVVIKSGFNWDIANAYYMDPPEGELDPEDTPEYTAEVDLQYGDIIGVGNWTNSDGSFDYIRGYTDFDSENDLYSYFSDDSDYCIVCLARGTYRISYKQGYYGSGTSIKAELSGPYSEEHLVCRLLAYDDEKDTCQDRFPDMKYIYLELDELDQERFRSFESSTDARFKAAYDRYVAWADALHQKRWEEGETLLSPGVLSINNANPFKMISIIAVIAVISASTLLAIVVINKKKTPHK